MQNEITPLQDSTQDKTIIDDGQMRYPVLTSELEAWETENGKITTENYEQFCDEVDHTMPGTLPGSGEMVRECAKLVEAGAEIYRPA